MLSKLKGAEALPFVMAMSGVSDQLEIYLRAHAALKGFDARVKILPFGTLSQYLFSQPSDPELFLILPWDLAPETDWRSGIGQAIDDVEIVLERADKKMLSISERTNTCVFYLPAPIPPLFSKSSKRDYLETELASIAIKNGARLLPQSVFSLSAYFASGSPISGEALSGIAEEIIEAFIIPTSQSFKVLVTDADNTLWSGIVGEDGVRGISGQPEGQSFRHFVYQTLLKRLKANGILLAIVSRNDEDLVYSALESDHFTVGPDDFVSIHADYGAKSEQIEKLSTNLNLSTDAMVFVDDNPIELAEVRSSLTSVQCLEFPKRDEDLPQFLYRLARFFDRTKISTEDSARTEMYRRRAVTSLVDPQKIEEFLRDLKMVVTVHDRTYRDWTRALQLINKTNQFNLNGRRLENSDIVGVLNNGGRLLTATLTDRFGSHGEIIACLIDQGGTVISFVMSCRIFLRRVEYVFVMWLLERKWYSELFFQYKRTERNEPLRQFLKDPSFSKTDKGQAVDIDKFERTHSALRELFDIRDDLV